MKLMNRLEVDNAIEHSMICDTVTHPECSILIDLDQSVTKHATTTAEQQQNEQIFLYLGCG